MTARYVIRELTGFPIGTGQGSIRLTTDVMVLDRDDCYRVVAYYSGEGRGHNRYTRRSLSGGGVRVKLVETLSS